MEELTTIWQRFRPELEAHLKHIVDRAPLPLYDMMRYHMGWIDELGRTRRHSAGKRLRPMICLHSCHTMAGQWRKALPAAAAVELVHNFSLIHDDIQDSSSKRRGRWTVWHIWGQPQAINAGDGMCALSFSSLLQLRETGVSPQKIVRATRLLSEAILQICEGQYRDMMYENHLDIDTDDYISMISGKTAALFRCSFELGALIATDDESTISHLGNFGHYLGMVFQVQDDVLSIWGDEKAMGKPGISDIKLKKKTLPVIFALQKTQGDNRNRLSQIYQKDTIDQADVEQILQLLDNADAQNHAREVIKRYYNQALSELDNLEATRETRAELKAIADLVINRTF